MQIATTKRSALIDTNQIMNPQKYKLGEFYFMLLIRKVALKLLVFDMGNHPVFTLEHSEETTSSSVANQT